SVYGGSQLVAHADATNNNVSEHTTTTGGETLVPAQSAVTFKNTITGENTEESSNNDQKSVANTTNSQEASQADVTADQTRSNSDAVTENELSLNATNSSNTSTTVDNAVSKVATTPTATATNDENTITVSTSQELIDAIQKGTATTINVANDITLDGTGFSNPEIANKRDIVIQSIDDQKKTINLNGYSFIMNSDNNITFKNLTLYDRNRLGVVGNAGGYIYDNVNYTGSRLVYTDRSATVTFKNNVNAHSVDKYTSPLDNTEYATDKGQQVIQFTTGTNNVIFESGSNVTLTSDNGDVIQNSGNATTITVQNGANVTINPHASTKTFEANTDQVARGIVSAGGSINVEQGGNLTFNLSQNTGDPYMPGALYLTNGATITDNGNIKINVNGQPSTGNSMPVYISGASTIKVGNGATFEITAQNLGSYAGSLFKIDGKGTIELDPQSTFKISGDGTGAVTGIELGTGSTFTSDQPKEFTIDLSNNTNNKKTLIKNGTINFTRVKNTNVDAASQLPIGKADVTFNSDGSFKQSILTAEGIKGKSAIDKVKTYLQGNEDNPLSVLTFVAAGEDVALDNVHLSKDNKLTGIASSSGDSTSPIYIVVKVDGEAVTLPNDGNYRIYRIGGGSSAPTKVKYNGIVNSNSGEFTIDLSSVADKLTPGAKISLVATKDFVDSPTGDKTVENLRIVNNIIEYKDKAGTVVKTEKVTGNDGDQININLPAGYHVDGGNVPVLVFTAKNPKQIVNVVKDQTATGEPTTTDDKQKDVANLINYVDQDGNNVGRQEVSGTDGDPGSTARWLSR
ncbi:MAG: pectate lyase-like adhesive domain-containing protein, partial [Candidatus Limosilactobacillus intestinavium]